MKYSGNTKERIYRYLADHGPSPSIEIERALDISQPTVSNILRGEADLFKLERTPALIYSKKLRTVKPKTVRATLNETLRLAIEIRAQLDDLTPDEIEKGKLDDLAQFYISKIVRLSAHLEYQLQGKQHDES